MRITSFIKPHNYGVENSNDKKFDYLSNDLWWFSFKCDHLGDNRDISSVKKKFKNGESELCKYILFCDFRGGMPAPPNNLNRSSIISRFPHVIILCCIDGSFLSNSSKYPFAIREYFLERAKERLNAYVDIKISVEKYMRKLRHQGE